MHYNEFLKKLGNPDPICFVDNNKVISLKDVPQYIDKYNIYFIPNIGGTKIEDIKEFKAFFVDLDAGRISKDEFLPGKAVKKYKDFPAKETQIVDWENEYKKAEQTGRKECTNNNFYVYDSYYTEYLQYNLDALKGYYSGIKLCESDEMQDYEIALKLFDQIGVKPYIIIVSTNGYYYDYVGLTREKRLKLYDELVSCAKNYKCDYLDLRDYEYTPYFFKDVMHLGWKGWLYLNEKFAEYFS